MLIISFWWISRNRKGSRASLISKFLYTFTLEKNFKYCWKVWVTWLRLFLKIFMKNWLILFAICIIFVWACWIKWHKFHAEVFLQLENTEITYFHIPSSRTPCASYKLAQNQSEMYEKPFHINMEFVLELTFIILMNEILE